MAMRVNTRKALMFVLLVASVGSIFYLLQPNIDEIKQADFSLHPFNIVIVVFFIVLMLFVKALVHSIMLDKYQMKSVSRQEVIAAYANGQVVRYLPGKVFGIISQSLKLSDVAKAAHVWEANVAQYAFTNIISIIVIFSLASYLFLESNLIVLLLILLSIFTVYLLVNGTITRLFNFTSRFVSLEPISIDTYSHSWKQSVLVIILLYVEWLLYFIAWYFLVDSSLLSSVYIGLLYAAASLVALLAFVVPNGILVREAIFLWLGSLLTLSADKLLFYGIVIRVLYIFCEVFFYLLAESLVKISAWQKN